MTGPWRHLEHVLETMTALINTSPAAAGAEQLSDVAALEAFIESRLITEVETPGPSDIEPMHRLRSQLRTVFAAPDQQARVPLVNGLLASARVTPRLTAHSGLGLHLHYFAPYATLEEHLLADCAMALADMVASGNGSRLRVCAAPDCSRVLVDGSRNQSRAYCDSGRCGSRVNSAAYRDRRRTP